MIRVKTCFVAEGVVTDRDTDQTSAFGLVEGVQAETYPLAIQKLAFFCLQARTPGDPQRVTGEFSLTLNGRDLARQSVDIDFQQLLQNRTTIRLVGLTLSEPGELVFRMAIPGHDTAEWTMQASRAAAGALGAMGSTGPSRLYDSGQVSISLGGALL